MVSSFIRRLSVEPVLRTRDEYQDIWLINVQSLLASIALQVCECVCVCVYLVCVATNFMSIIVLIRELWYWLRNMQIWLMKQKLYLSIVKYIHHCIWESQYVLVATNLVHGNYCCWDSRNFPQFKGYMYMYLILSSGVAWYMYLWD